MPACLDVGGGLTPSAEDALIVNLDGDNLFPSEWLLWLPNEDGPRLVNVELTVAHYKHPRPRHLR